MRFELYDVRKTDLRTARLGKSSESFEVLGWIFSHPALAVESYWGPETWEGFAVKLGSSA